MITGKNYIGSRTSSLGSKIFKTFNPISNKENEQTFYEASTQEIKEAVDLAWEAFLSYQDFSGERKSEFLNAIADEIESLGDDLIDMYCAESGLPAGRAMGERGRTVFQLRSFAELLKSGRYLNQMTRQEMQAILVLEYVKSMSSLEN